MSYELRAVFGGRGIGLSHKNETGVLADDSDRQGWYTVAALR
jgi:hypothetical protein